MLDALHPKHTATALPAHLRSPVCFNRGSVPVRSTNPPLLFFSLQTKRALGGGCTGALAMLLQVLCMMWLRTAVNYQYRHGGTVVDAFTTLYAEGGVPRFYQGLGAYVLSRVTTATCTAAHRLRLTAPALAACAVPPHHPNASVGPMHYS